ncbi:MAG: hypothetical protein AB7F22_16000 [Reyranella sp.]|uniref:hypothetical protein n=1 Tax=Reyranella sp. TaxID=1929291 RepID=UPI003D149394
MIEDMTVGGFTACPQRGYIAAVRRFTVFLRRSPDQATKEDLLRFQLQMREEGVSCAGRSVAPFPTVPSTSSWPPHAADAPRFPSTVVSLARRSAPSATALSVRRLPLP